MDTPMDSIFGTPGKKGVTGNYDTKDKASAGGMDSPFTDGTQAPREVRDTPVRITESLNPAPADLNTPFGTSLPFKR